MTSPYEPVLVHAAGKEARTLLADLRSLHDPLGDTWLIVDKREDFEQRVRDGLSPALVIVSSRGTDLTAWVSALSNRLGKGLVTLESENQVHPSRRDPRRGPTPTTPHDLEWALSEARVESVLRQQAWRVRDSRLADPFKRLVEVALVADPPFGSVKTWAARVQRPGRYVWAQWRQNARAGTPKGFLDEIVLARALMGRVPDASWDQVAGRMQCNPQRLRRIATRRLGRCLSEGVEDNDLRAKRRLVEWLTDSLGLPDREVS